MMRYLRLYAHFLRFSFSKAMEFRVDFYFRVVMDICFYIVQFLFFDIIYLHTPLLAGWGVEEMRIFIASYIFIDALHMTVFANNCWWLPIYINRGDLDYYLTKPVSTLFFLSLREFAANSFLNLIIASSVLGYIIHSYPGDFTISKIVIFILLLILGSVLYFFVHLLFLLSVFWTQSPRGFGDVFFAISHTMERPDRLFTGVFRFIFLFILPFSLMASYPAKFLLEDGTNYVIYTLLSVTIGFFFITQYVWRKGLKVYSSASS